MTQVSMLVPVKYEGAIKVKVDHFNALPRSEQSGAYWGATDSGNMADVKKFIKDHYKVAQEYRCPYCYQRIVVEHNGSWDAEHIIPKDMYPQFMFEPRNLCVSCRDCNIIKLNKNVLRNKDRISFPVDPDDYIMPHPHFHVYTDHIKVIKEAAFYLPKTDKGRMLIEICGLLRFVLKFANYECGDDGTGMLMVELGTQLSNADSEVERIAIMSTIKTLVDEGLRKSALAQIERITSLV